MTISARSACFCDAIDRGRFRFQGTIPVIRQAISCDICGAEMQRGNHWFVAHTHGGELRVSGWSANQRLRAGAKHLCGQTCLHKLVDEFLARTVHARAQAIEVGSPTAEQKAQRPRATRIGANLDASLTSSAAYIVPQAAPERQGVQSVAASQPRVDEFQSSAQLIASNDSVAGEQQDRETDAPAYASRKWHTEAWKRERERTQRGDAHATVLTPHRRTIA